MAANEYGVTAATMPQWFPTAIPFASSARVDSTLVASIVTSVAGDIQAALYESCPNDSEITATTAPIAYAWLGKTLALGTAIRIMESVDVGADGTLSAWRDEFAERMRTLRDKPRAVLADLASFRPKSRTVSLWR